MQRSPNKPGDHQASEPAAGYSRLPVRVQRDGVLSEVEDCIAEEVPVALIYNGQPHVVMMATPSDLADFALGFSLSEAVIRDAWELESLSISQLDNGYEISLRIPAARHAGLSDRKRNLVGRSGCGLCGSETIAEAMRIPPHVSAGTAITVDALHAALASLRDSQTINAATGATHAAGWADSSGRLLAVREDVGRHNALDKLIGAITAQGLETSRGFAVITSRASYEMVLKSASVGIPLLAAISAPTALAIRLAEEAGLTLIGFARNHNHVVYACPARLLGSENAPIQTGPKPA